MRHDTKRSLNIGNAARLGPGGLKGPITDRHVRGVIRFWRNKSGSHIVLAALVMPALVGFAGLGTEGGLWYYKQQSMQAAADSAAISAATELVLYDGQSVDLNPQADSVTASYGFVNGVNGTTVSVNVPPKLSNHKQPPGSVEVIVTQPQTRLFSALWTSAPLTISVRAVANGNAGLGCVLALDQAASGAATNQGTVKVDLNNCSLYDDSSNATALIGSGSASVTALSVGVVGGVSGANVFTTTLGLVTGHSRVPDPYSAVNFPSFSGCNQNHFRSHSTETINPGVYCNGITLDGGAYVTMNPGIYYLDRGGLTQNGGSTLVGTGVTLVFTSSTGSNYGTATINGGASANLTPPTSGPTAGIVFFGDRNMPVGTSFLLNGGGSMALGGAVYLPEAAVSFSGGAATAMNCTQLIGDTVTFSGNAQLALNCAGYPINPIGTTTASLNE